MFGGAKPSFGTGTASTGFTGFNSPAQASPFGQSAFGKPATTAFGTNSAFGTQQTTPSLFGSTAAPAQPTNLFGGPTTSSAFGATTAAPTAFGGFSQPQQNTSIFGAAQGTQNTGSLFGQSGTSAFGAAVKPGGLGGFGQSAAAQPTSTLFGQSAAVSSNSGFGGFGQAAPTTTNVFGSGSTSAFGQPQTTAAASGTNTGSSLIKYQPTIGSDTLMKGGQPNNVSTKQHCITAMKEYENKSLEELRMDDYLANRKGPQAGANTGSFFGGAGNQNQQPGTTTGLFGNAAQTSTGLFGQTAAGGTENKSLFGQNAFGQTAATSAFGQAAQQGSNFMAKPFGAPGTSAFGNTATDNSNPFGTKPAFGQTGTPSLFGQTNTTNQTTAFGQTNTGFSGFGGTAAQQQPSLFGSNNPADANKPAFGLGTAATNTNTGFGGFGTTPTSNAGGGSIFGAKTNTGFGAAPAFGGTSTANTGFGNFSMNNSNTGAGGGLFNSSINKPATTGFGGFGAQTSQAPLNFNTGNTGGSLFGNTANKPGGLFGGTNTLGVPTSAAGGGSLFGGGQSAFGNNPIGGGGAFGSLGGGSAFSGVSQNALQQQQTTAPIHHQILSKVTSPFGDTPIFKDLKRSDETDSTRATNPAAQQAVLDKSKNHLKLDTKASAATLKVKPVGITVNKKSLFEGLEESDTTVENFSLKSSSKRLVIKPKADNGTMSVNTNARTSVTDASNSVTSNSEQIDSRSEISSGGIVLETVRSPANVVLSTTSTHSKDADSSRRESWLHPNNLEKVRQHNINAGIDNSPQLNSTLSELVPRKPLETYRPSIGNRLSISTIPENPFEDQTNISLTRRETVAFAEENSANESLFTNRSYGAQEDRSVIEETETEYEIHPTGIQLRRVGYYTIPSLDDLKSYLAEDGSCVVPNFTVGRESYGNVYFGKEMDVAGLNLDDIVHFRNKEVIIYPDDESKPEIGVGLNREAQVTLDQVWPHDKTKHEPIKDPERLAEMDWEAKLRRVCDKNDTRFIEFRAETGSWVFRVKHFSKYGLNDSDEDDEQVPTDPKKAKMTADKSVKPNISSAAVVEKMTLSALKHAQKISEEAARALDPKALAAGVAAGVYGRDEAADFMLMDKTQFFQNHSQEFSMFAPTKPVTSPTAALAEDLLSNDTHKMQLMKSSFFIADDNENRAVGSSPGPGNLAHRNLRKSIFHHEFNDSTQLLWNELGKDVDGSSETSSQFDFGLASPTLPQSSSVESAVSNVRGGPLTESSSPALDSDSTDVAPHLVSQAKTNFTIKPKVAHIKGLASQVPFVTSIAHELCSPWIADLGLYNCRRFKLGFGPQTTLIVPNTRNNLKREIQAESLFNVVPHIFKPRAVDDFSATILQHVQITATQHYKNFDQSVVNHLKIQLRNCEINEVEDSECPWLQADGGTDLIVKHLDEAIKQTNLGPLEEYGVSVWSLLLALWGEHEELEGRELTSHFTVMCRRNFLSEWFENTLAEKDLLTRQVSQHTYLEHMLDLLMCHKVTEACELAFSYDDVNLALMLSQLSSGPIVRKLMENQLAAWSQNKSDKYINKERLKMYMLVAGVSLMDSAHGAINTLEGIDWIKSLAIQLWYLTSPTSSITDALLAYEKSFKSSEFYSMPPTPNYLNESYYSGKNIVYDMRYHLLQLYSKRSHPLESLLNPATHTTDPMDYRLSWMILQTLRALGYHHCAELSESQLHVGFATQLENNGLWEWAIFVLLHIDNRNQRELAVQNLLYRYVSFSNDVELTDKEQFVINNLGVPEKWIDYAKAVKAGASGNRQLQAKYLLKAKQWALAHEIIFEHIAPDAIINDKQEYLHSLLSQFECTHMRTNIKVPNWSNQGQIFLDFIDISEKFRAIKSIQNTADIEAHWESLKPQLADICSRINLLPCPTSKHRLCQSEIAQHLACLVRGVLIVCPNLNACMIIKIALERLPLPQEFAMKELHTLLDALVKDIGKTRIISEQDEMTAMRT